MKALVLRHEPDGPSGEIGVRLTERGIDLDDHLITPDIGQPRQTTGPLPAYSDFDMLVVMGSVRSLTQKDEIDTWIYAELELLRSAHSSNVPILGICFGGQLLAEMSGGLVEPAPSAEIGWYEISPIEGTDCPVGAGPWMQWHHDRFVAPPEAEVMAKSAAGQQLFRLGRSVGTQFHPEITEDVLDGWLVACDTDYVAEHNVDVDQLRLDTRLNQAASAVACHRLVDWFLDSVAFK